MQNPLLVGTDSGVVAYVRERDMWREVSRGLEWLRVTCAVAVGASAFVGTTDGIYRSDDLGETWQLADVGLHIRHIRWLGYAPERGRTLLAGTEPASIFVTHDLENWRECLEVGDLRDRFDWNLPYSPAAGCVRGFAFHRKRVYAAVEQGGLLRSDDAGETWRLVEGSSGQPGAEPSSGQLHSDVHSVAVHPTSPDLVFAATGGGLYRSADGGATWSCLYECYCRALWIDPTNPNRIIFGPADGVDRKGMIEETRDGGHTWRLVAAGVTAPWPRHMVERFTYTGDELLAVLSNGELLAASPDALIWQRMLERERPIEAVATVTLTEHRMGETAEELAVPPETLRKTPLGRR